MTDDEHKIVASLRIIAKAFDQDPGEFDAGHWTVAAIIRLCRRLRIHLPEAAFSAYDVRRIVDAAEVLRAADPGDIAEIQQQFRAGLIDQFETAIHQ